MGYKTYGPVHVMGPSQQFFSLVGTEPPLSRQYQFRGVKCLPKGHNTAEVGFENPTSRSEPSLSRTKDWSRVCPF